MGRCAVGEEEMVIGGGGGIPTMKSGKVVNSIYEVYTRYIRGIYGVYTGYNERSDSEAICEQKRV